MKKIIEMVEFCHVCQKEHTFRKEIIITKDVVNGKILFQQTTFLCKVESNYIIGNDTSYLPLDFKNETEMCQYLQKNDSQLFSLLFPKPFPEPEYKFELAKTGTLSLVNYPDLPEFESQEQLWDFEENELGGNLTMGIVSQFRKTSFFAVEFDTFPPRGEELSHTDLEKFGIRLVEYVILQSSKKAVETALQFAVAEGGYSI